MKYTFIEELQSAFYPTQNKIMTMPVCGKNFYYWAYLFLIIAIITRFLFLIIKNSWTSKSLTLIIPSPVKQTRNIVAIFVIIISLFQVFYQRTFLINAGFRGEYPPEYYNALSIAYKSKELISKESSVLFITDVDISQDPGMYYSRYLNYIAYPIKMALKTSGNDEYIVYYEKRKATSLLPENYKIIYKLNERNLIAKKIKEPRIN